MSTYPTNDKTGADNLVAFALAVRSKCLELTATDGKLSDLTTSAKTNLVTAINELVTGLNTVNDIIAKKTEIDDTKSTTSNVWSASKTATEIATTATNLKNDLLGGVGEAYDTLKELADLINNNKTAIEALQEIASGHVKFNEVQSLSDTQKATARSNIGASATVHTHTISAITGLQAELDTKALASSLAVVATSGSYNDLSNKPTKVSAFENDKGYLTAHQSLDAYATKASLATVATSGSYSDLLNKPTKVSVFDNDKGYLTEHQSLADYTKTSSLAKVATSGSYSDLSNTPTIPTVPTVVSAFTNDAGYLISIADASITTTKLADTIDLGSV